MARACHVQWSTVVLSQQADIADIQLETRRSRRPCPFAACVELTGGHLATSCSAALCLSAGSAGGHLARFSPRRVVSPEGRPGT